MIQIDLWMNELTRKLTEQFADQLLFVGLQGSYQRNEAHEESDIDAVVILETLSMRDIALYRALLQSMPESEKACGFISGRQELYNWATHELFQFEQDTHAYYGSLHELLPPIDQMDIARSAKISACNLYHAVCHAAIHDSDPAEALKGLYKAAFFLLQIVYYRNTGDYIHTKRDLLPKLNGEEREILSLSMNWPMHAEQVRTNPDFYFDRLIQWSAAVLATAF
ncbi:MAG: nucleotidyltransferase domain-containing protein [Eubacteriales bacterium]|nr:nucleotidyltransferase domain-containing protein [Eubacteriales bacterium]